MGTTRTLADGEAFVQGRSQATAKALVSAAADADLKGTVRTTYDGYIAPVEVVEAAGFGSASSTESSTPENPADHSDPAPVKADTEDDGESIPDPADAPDEDVNPEGQQFDPSAATIAEVKSYLADVDDVERTRVIDAEKASAKPRTGVLELAAIPEGDK
jgi:hypothetical protein